MKEYLKPEAELVALFAQEAITDEENDDDVDLGYGSAPSDW